MSGMGDVGVMRGTQITQKRNEGTLKMNQEQNVKSVLRRDGGELFRCGWSTTFLDDNGID